MSSSSAGLRTPLPPRLRTWVYTIAMLTSLSHHQWKLWLEALRMGRLSGGFQSCSATRWTTPCWAWRIPVTPWAVPGCWRQMTRPT